MTTPAQTWRRGFIQSQLKSFNQNPKSSSVCHLQHMCSTELPSCVLCVYVCVLISQLALGQHLIQHLDVLQCLQSLSKVNSWFVCAASPCSIIES